MRRSLRIIAAATLALAIVAPVEGAQKKKASSTKAPAPAATSRTARTARTAYDRTLARERTLRASRRKAPLSQMRAVIEDYEAIARRWPTSGYADNALWNGANLAYDANISYGAKQERDSAMEMLRWLVKEYPSSSLARDAQTRLRKISAAAPKTTKADAGTRSARAEPAAPPPRPPNSPRPTSGPPRRNRRLPMTRRWTKAPRPRPARPPPRAARPPLRHRRPSPCRPCRTSRRGRPSRSKVVVREVKRVVLPEVVRVTIELDGEVAYHEEALQNPSRLFFDLSGASLAPAIEEGVRTFTDGDVVREIRIGTHPGGVDARGARYPRCRQAQPVHALQPLPARARHVS